MTKQEKQFLLDKQGYYYHVELIWADGSKTEKDFGNKYSAASWMDKHPNKKMEKIQNA